MSGALVSTDFTTSVGSLGNSLEAVVVVVANVILVVELSINKYILFTPEIPIYSSVINFIVIKDIYTSCRIECFKPNALKLEIGLFDWAKHATFSYNKLKLEVGWFV